MMKLYFSDASPYARKVRVMICELGLDEKVEAIACSPFDDVAELVPVNPLSKVPVLITDDGTALFDSPVICEYLASLVPNSSLIPPDGADKWVALRRQALADGILDAAFSIVMESRRPEGEQSPSWIDHWALAISRAAAALDKEAGSFSEKVDIGQIAVASAFGYLDLRLDHLGWRAGNDAAASWYADFSERPSMIATSPAG